MSRQQRGPARLIAGAVLLAVCGRVLVGVGMGEVGNGAASLPTTASPDVPPAPVAAPHPELAGASPTSPGPSPASPPAPGVTAGRPATNLPPPLSGPGADPVVQRAVEDALPPDLPPDIEEEVAQLGRRVWLAEVTGAGRDQWPGYFLPAPARSSFYTRVRVQAAIGRRDPDRPGVVAHLVWAGAGPSGTYMDGRSATVRFIRKGETGTWTPQR